MNTILGHYQTTGEKLSAQVFFSLPFFLFVLTFSNFKSITHLTGGSLKAATNYVDLYKDGKKNKICLEQNFGTKLNSGLSFLPSFSFFPFFLTYLS